MYENIINKDGNKFYKVKKSMVIDAQKDLGILFPNELVQFYAEIGYGFLNSNEENFNRLMDPNSVAEFRLRKGQYANYSELEIYTDYERDKLIFFEICEGYFLSIGFSGSNRGVIFDGEKRIAKNLEEFLIKYQENENYFK